MTDLMEYYLFGFATIVKHLSFDPYQIGPEESIMHKIKIKEDAMNSLN